MIHKNDNHEHEHKHEHSHDTIDISILTTQKGIWAVKWSFILLSITAFLQLIVVYFTGSIALLADTIHNFGDAATAIPLAIAFMLARHKPSKRFTFGLGRVEDIAGVMIILIILSSAIFAGYESIYRLFHPQPIKYLWAIILASIIGFIGNEAVAMYRIKVGKEIGSAALIADGYHSRTDGYTSLAVLLGAIGVYFGYPLADPIIGIGITIMILSIVWDSCKTVFIRILDGVEPNVTEEIKHTAHHVNGVLDVSDVHVRWIGHRMNAEISIAVNPKLSVEKGHDIAKEVRHKLISGVKYLSEVRIHIDPLHSSGNKYHGINH